MTRIMLVDADTIVRRRMRRVLEHGGELQVVAEAGSAVGALHALETARPDVLLMSSAARGVEEVGAGTPVYSRLAGLPAVLLIPRGRERNAVKLRRTTARGLVATESATTEIVAAVQAVAVGKRFVSPVLAPLLDAEDVVGVGQVDPLSLLTHRERQILELLAQSLSPKEIAAGLRISPTTVRNYQARVLAKLQLKNTLELGRFLALRELSHNKARGVQL